MGGAEGTVYRTYTDQNHIKHKAHYTVMFILKAVFFELLLFVIVHIPVLGYWFWRCFYFYFYDGRNKVLMCMEVGMASIEGKGRQVYTSWE